MRLFSSLFLFPSSRGGVGFLLSASKLSTSSKLQAGAPGSRARLGPGTRPGRLRAGGAGEAGEAAAKDGAAGGEAEGAGGHSLGGLGGRDPGPDFQVFFFGARQLFGVSRRAGLCVQAPTSLDGMGWDGSGSFWFSCPCDASFVPARGLTQLWVPVSSRKFVIFCCPMGQPFLRLRSQGRHCFCQQTCADPHSTFTFPQFNHESQESIFCTRISFRAPTSLGPPRHIWLWAFWAMFCAWPNGSQVEAEDGVDYDKLIETFGCQPITQATSSRLRRRRSHRLEATSPEYWRVVPSRIIPPVLRFSRWFP